LLATQITQIKSTFFTFSSISTPLFFYFRFSQRLSIMHKSIEHQNLVTKPLNALLPTNIDGFEQLAGLALDLSWSWNHASDSVWRELDTELWELTHNPWAVLQTVSHAQIETLLKQPKFRQEVDQLVNTQQSALNAPAWFQQEYSDSNLKCIAYFSMEFMLSEALPIYSGGLGNVAGDQLKAASDLGVPVVGVGLLYQQGYFRQVIDKNGAQQSLYPYNDPGQLPISPLRQASGDWLRLKVDLSGHSVWLRAWQVQVGRVKLYLLDTNDAANIPAHRGITSELYGGDSELRLQQELLLGIGGWRLLEALDIHPEVCHLNEGHAAFAVLERAQSFMAQTQQPFAVALAATRAGNVFTTHTAVSAGFDRFTPALVEQYLGHYASDQLGISLQDLLSLGRKDPKDMSENFNMAYLAIRGSGAVNGVSKLHEEVSRHLFEPLFSRWPHAEIPVGHITNGVHMASWDSAAADEVWTEACGKDRWRDMDTPLKDKICCVTDEKIWKLRNTNRQSLLDFTRVRLSRQLAAAGYKTEELLKIEKLLNADILTLGFARRFATYKRNNLLLQDPARLLRLLTNTSRPVQLIIAGKAHPQDLQGQALIRDWIQFISQPEVPSHIVFLSDYDMRVAEHMVQGVDVWINTPRRPWEASGTSGMKVLVNGGINLSELDGWWAEAYSPELGWALGDGEEHGDDPAWDVTEANALYELLENEVIPEFYQRDVHGLPRTWLQRIRESMAQLTPQFSVTRTLREYTEQRYLPAAASYIQRAANQGKRAAEIVAQQQNLTQHWESIHFGTRRDSTRDGQHYVEVEVYIDNFPAQGIQVELHAEMKGNAESVRHGMQLLELASSSASPSIYCTHISADRPLSDFSARLFAHLEGVSIPLEESHIRWQE
jgi:starch phosphorylase